MPKIVVTYDPNDFYSAWPDAWCEREVNDLIEWSLGKNCEYVHHTVSRRLAVDYFRLAVASDRIKPEDIEFRFRNKVIKVYPGGRLDPWPRGFCDYEDNVVEKLLDWWR